MSVRIRAADSKDLETLIRLGETMRRESWIYFPEIDRDCTAHFLKTIIENPDQGCWLLAEVDGHAAGFLVGLMGHYGFSPEKVASHNIWLVDRQFRASKAAVELVKAFEAWAREHGAIRTRMAVESGLNVERVGKFLERQGYERMGAYYGKLMNV